MKKILIIEDNDDIRENLVEILELAGYEAHSAENGKIGVELAEKILPDLILCDVTMPVLDGYGTLNILQKKPHTAEIPFIFLTARSEKNDFRYGMNLGADDYISKPFESNELLNVIELRLKKVEKNKKTLEISHSIPHHINEAKSLEALKTLIESRETRLFAKKNHVYTEDSVPRHFFYIQRGKVKISKTNDDGKELIIDILGKDDYFGQLALLNGTRYTDSATTLEDCEIILIPKEDFFTLMSSNRDVSGQFIKILAGHVVSQETRLLELAYNSVRKRVADALVILNDRYSNKPISILREDIAALAGTAKETLIRTLTDFKEEKMIDIEEGRIRVINPEKLKNLCN